MAQRGASVSQCPTIISQSSVNIHSLRIRPHVCHRSVHSIGPGSKLLKITHEFSLFHHDFHHDHFVHIQVKRTIYMHWRVTFSKSPTMMADDITENGRTWSSIHVSGVCNLSLFSLVCLRVERDPLGSYMITRRVPMPKTPFAGKCKPPGSMRTARRDQLVRAAD